MQWRPRIPPARLPRHNERTCKDRLSPVYMFVCALIIIGLVVTGVLEVRWAARLPVAQVIAK